MNNVTLSRLESVVADYLMEIDPNILVVPQARVIRRTKKTRYEIDLYLPEMLLGFEVQDFATHSRTESTDRNPWNKKMKGPTYHAMKNKLALEQLGVEIVELWQDEIEDGSFREKVDHVLQSRAI